MANEEAEAMVEEQARMFEEHKDYLIKRWDDPILKEIAQGIACEI
jgi:hypothetical protein